MSAFDIEIAAEAQSKTGTFTLTPTDDVVDETNETVTVSGESGSLTVNAATITLTDDDDAPTAITLTVNDNSMAEDDGATEITVTATVDGTTRFAAATTVTVSVGGSGTATAVDFAAVNAFDIEIAAEAQSKTGTFTLTPTDDVVDETDETVTVGGTSGSLTVNSATITLTDDDAAPTAVTLTVNDNSVGEGDGATTITVTATVDGTTRFAEATTVSVNVAGSGTASAVDFAAVSDFDVEIDAGDASGTGTFTLTPTDDAVDGTDETITVSGSSGSLTVSSATITLTDDDTRAVTLSASTLSVPENGSAEYTVKLAAQPAQPMGSDDVTVTITGAGGGLTASPTALTFDGSSWDTPQSVTVSAAADVNEVNERVTLTHTPAGADYGGVTVADEIAEIVVTAADDDATTTPPPPANLPPRAVGSLPDLNLDIGESASLRLAGVFTDAGPLTHRAESSAPEVASARVEGNATLRVRGLSPGLATVTVTATDRGGLSSRLSLRASVGRVLSFAAPSASAPEGGVLRLALTLSRPAGAALSVAWTARPDGNPATADADAADLGALRGTAAFAPGGTEALIEIAVPDDDDIEPAREFLVADLAAPPEGADWTLGLSEALLEVREGGVRPLAGG